MSLSHFVRISLSLALALSISGTAYYQNLRVLAGERVEFGLRISQQVETQIETLVTRAQEKLENDPLEWAIRALAVGPELRPVQIAPFKTGTPIEETEKYRLNSKTGLFSYVKIFNHENGEGVRIHVHLGYVGFLGAKSTLISDLLVLGFFILTFSFWLQVTGAIRRTQKVEFYDESSEEEGVGVELNQGLHEGFLGPSIHQFQNSVPSSTASANSLALANHVSDWATEAKATLMQLGIHVKNMTKEAQALTLAAAQSRGRVEVLTQTSLQFKNFTLELESTLGESEEGFPRFRENFGRLKELAEKSIADAENAFSSYDGVFKTTQDLNNFISKTKEALLTEAKMLQNLKEQVLAAPALGQDEGQKKEASIK